jgi:hypothetical protein
MDLGIRWLEVRKKNEWSYRPASSRRWGSENELHFFQGASQEIRKEK